jgi:hypothetical protein
MKIQNHLLTPLASLVLGLGLLAILHPTHVQAAAIYWVNPISGSWFDPMNWSYQHVPTSSDDVFITVPGTYTVGIDGPAGTPDAVAGSLTLGDSGGTQTLALGLHGYLSVVGSVNTATNTLITLDNGALINAQGGGLIAGTVEWTSGWFWGPFTIAPGGILNLRGPGPMHLRNDLINHGVINWFDGAWDFTQCLLDNRSDGLINFTNGGTLGLNWSPATINNAGTLRKSGGTNSVSMPSPFQFTNSGLVSVQSGALSFDYGLTSSGTFDVATNAALRLAYGSFNFLPGHHCQGDGYYGAPGPSAVALQGEIPDANFQLDSGMADGSSVLVTGTLQWNSGDIYGTVTVASNGTLNARGPGYKRLPRGTLANHGVVNWSQGGWEVWNSTIINHADGLFVVAQDGGFAFAGGVNVMQNAGTFRKSAGAGILDITLPVTNTGIFDVQSGILRFDSAYDQAGGQLNVGLRSDSDYGQVVFSSPVLLTGTLSADLLGGYAPAAGTQFQVISSGGLTGGFNALNLPNHFFETNSVNSVFLAVGDGGPVSFLGSAVTGTNFTCSFQTEAGQSYTVEYNDDLNPANWEDYYTLSGDGSLVQCLMPMTNSPQRFFRVRQP